MNDQECRDLIERLGPLLAKYLEDSGKSCKGSCSRTGDAPDPNCSIDTYLSKYEVENLTSQRSDVLNFGPLAPGDQAAIVVPPYGIGHRVVQFKFRPTMAPGGDADALLITITHADRTIFTFRGLEFFEEFCCALFDRMRPSCFGRESEWTVTVQHTGAVGDPIMQRASLTYTRAYPGETAFGT
jgi:hypothetical protein